jgi:hypothetical protein
MKFKKHGKEKLFLMVAFSVFLIFIMSITAHSAEVAYSEATITLTDTCRSMVMVCHEDGRAIHAVSEGGMIPLTYGRGSYEIRIYEVSGDTGTLCERHMVECHSQYDYLGSNQEIVITEDVINIAAELGGARKCFGYVVENVAYDFDFMATAEFDYLPKATRTLETGKGVCYDYASLFASLTRSLGYPTKLVKGYHQGNYHAWNEIMINGDWVLVDCTAGNWGNRSGYFPISDS